MTGEKVEKPSVVLSLKGLIAASAFAVCLLTLAGFFGETFWMLDLCAHFRMQYLVLLSIVAIFLLIGKKLKIAAFFAVFALINLLAVAPLFFTVDKAENQASWRLRILSLNVNSAGGNPESVMKLIRESNVDLIALQEISSRWVEALSKQRSAHPFSIISPREDNFGIALLSKIPISDSLIEEIGAAGVPSIIVTLNWQSHPLKVIITHPLPPIGQKYAELRDDQLEQLVQHVEPNVLTVLAGDFNTTPWGYSFKRLLQKSGLKNSAAGFGYHGTWPAANPFLRIPIDHVLLSPEFMVIDRTIGENVGSDHLPVIVEFGLSG